MFGLFGGKRMGIRYIMVPPGTNPLDAPLEDDKRRRGKLMVWIAVGCGLMICMVLYGLMLRAQTAQAATPSELESDRASDLDAATNLDHSGQQHPAADLDPAPTADIHP